MKDERLHAERMFWQTVYKAAAESGQEPAWETLGYPVAQKKFNGMVAKFHEEPAARGFHGVRIRIGEVNGFLVSLLVENQTELVIGLRLEESPDSNGDLSMDVVRDIMEALYLTGRSWNFEAPGWIAWKTPEIRLNFRSAQNKAFMDICMNKSGSEALYLIAGEISDILGEIREIMSRLTVLEYGTVAI